MAADYVEAVLTWRSGSADASVAAWLEARGFATVPMQAGLLITGSSDAFAATFGADVAGRTEHVALPLPPALRASVASIRVSAPAIPHGQ